MVFLGFRNPIPHFPILKKKTHRPINSSNKASSTRVITFFRTTNNTNQSRTQGFAVRVCKATRVGGGACAMRRGLLTHHFYFPSAVRRVLHAKRFVGSIAGCKVEGGVGVLQKLRYQEWRNVDYTTHDSVAKRLLKTSNSRKRGGQACPTRIFKNCFQGE